MVSSFLASLLTGTIAPINLADASVTGLLDIKNKNWAGKVLEAIGQDLENKVSPPVDSQTVIGTVSEYMQNRYGSDSNCKVTVSVKEIAER